MNEEYYIITDNAKNGPYTLDELMDMDINIHTKIITSINDAPQYASDLPELNEYFMAQGLRFPTEDNLASFGKRTAAFLVDYFGIYIIVSNLATRTGWIVLPTDYSFGKPLPNSMLMLTLSVLTSFWLYNTICEATSLKGSLGKKIFKLMVVDINGKGLSMPRAALRNLGVVLSITIWIPFLSVFFSEHRQAWYDNLAKTYIIAAD